MPTTTKTKKYAHELAVEFGGVSIGDNTASVGIGFERNGHALEDVDAMLCGKRLEVFAVVGSAADQAQQQLPGIDSEPRPHVEATCDSASVRVTPKHFGSRLKFSLEEIDVTEIAGIAKRAGTLRLNVLGDLDGDAEDESEEPDEEIRLRQRKLKAPPRSGNGPQNLDPGAAMTIEALTKLNVDGKAHPRRRPRQERPAHHHGRPSELATQAEGDSQDDH